MAQAPTPAPSEASSYDTGASSSHSADRGHAQQSTLARGKACLRCRKRKMRCSGGQPACNQCVKANRADGCQYDDGKGKTRTQALRERIQILESQIKRMSEAGLSLTEAGLAAGVDSDELALLTGTQGHGQAIRLFDPHAPPASQSSSFSQPQAQHSQSLPYPLTPSLTQPSFSPFIPQQQTQLFSQAQDLSFRYSSPSDDSSLTGTGSPNSIGVVGVPPPSPYGTGAGVGTFDSPHSQWAPLRAFSPSLQSQQQTTQGQAISEEITPEVAVMFLDILLPSASLACLALDPSRLRNSLALPVGHADRRSSVLVDAIALWACYLSRPGELCKHEDAFVSRVLRGINDSLARLDNEETLEVGGAPATPAKQSPSSKLLMDVIQAEIMLSKYFYVCGRAAEAAYHARGVSGLVVGAEMHRIRGSSSESSSRPVSFSGPSPSNQAQGQMMGQTQLGMFAAQQQGSLQSPSSQLMPLSPYPYPYGSTNSSTVGSLSSPLPYPSPSLSPNPSSPLPQSGSPLPSTSFGSDSIEQGEQILLFWHAYVLDRELSVHLKRPVSIKDEGFDRWSKIDTPWPLDDAAEYDAMTPSSLHGSNTVANFLYGQGQGTSGGFSRLALRAKAAALLERGKRISDNWGISPSQKQEFSMLEQSLQRFVSTLTPVQQLSSSGSSTANTSSGSWDDDRLTYIHSHLLAQGTVMEMFGRLVPSSPNAVRVAADCASTSQKNCVKAARAVASLVRNLTDADWMKTEPVVAVVLITSLSILNAEQARMQAPAPWAPTLDVDVRPDLETLVYSLSALGGRWPVVGAQAARITSVLSYQ